MYNRLFKVTKNQSFFLFGPRGCGKTYFVKKYFPKALYLDLLDSNIYIDFLANPSRLENLIPKDFNDWIILDEVQKIPALLDEVHRLIENKKYKFVLTGSSARSLRKKGVNLLAGRALTYHMHPFIAQELKEDFNIKKALEFGLLPMIYSENIDPKKYLKSYVQTYLKEEVLQEGLTRNLSAFSRFLEIASFSQGSVLNMSEIGKDAAISRKMVESYFQIIEDLLLGYKINVFTKRAKRKTISHPKFYFFDVCIYKTLRPKGPLDIDTEIDGAGLETLFLQSIRAINDYLDLEYEIFYWRTQDKKEIDFILYGPKGFFAFEIKRSQFFKKQDFTALKAFSKDYPSAKLYFLYTGQRNEVYEDINVVSIDWVLKNLHQVI